jgi:hypothetical protein
MPPDMVTLSALIGQIYVPLGGYTGRFIRRFKTQGVNFPC